MQVGEPSDENNELNVFEIVYNFQNYSQEVFSREVLLPAIEKKQACSKEQGFLLCISVPITKYVVAWYVLSQWYCCDKQYSLNGIIPLGYKQRCLTRNGGFKKAVESRVPG